MVPSKGRSRSKRQAGMIFPPSGFRIRREYRRLTDGDRMALHAAFNQMKMVLLVYLTHMKDVFLLEL